jgi:hypothetical protein
VSGRGSGALAAEEGRRRAPAQVRRGQAKHREHEKEKEQVWRLRKSEEKIGKGLTVTKTRRSGGLLSTEILAALFGENKAATCDLIGVGAQRGSGRLFKGASRAEQGSRGRLRALPVRTRGGVRLGHEVEDTADR